MIRNDAGGALGSTMTSEQILAVDEKHRPAIEAAVKARNYAEAKRLHDEMQREMDALEVPEVLA